MSRAILEAHGTEAGEVWEVRPDHVVFDEDAGDFATWVLAHEWGSPAAAPLGLVVADARGASGWQRSDARPRRLERRAHEVGLHFGPPGLGRCDHVYTDGFAAPGRMAIAAGRGASAAGAIGTLVLSVSALEAAVAAAGAPLAVTAPIPFPVHLRGTLTPGLSGHDVLIEVAQRSGGELPPAGIIEFAGSGVSGLTMADRLAIATQVERVGAKSVLFPADERTRLWLAARRRDAEWKRLGDTEDVPDESFVIEPWLCHSNEPDQCRRLRHRVGSRVSTVLIGPGASEADLDRLVAWLTGRTVVPEVRCLVIPGSRRALHTIQRPGARETLRAAGVQVTTHTTGSSHLGARGRNLYYGVSRMDPLPEGEVASLEACVAAALSGSVVDPRTLAWPGVGPLGGLPEPSMGLRSPGSPVARPAATRPLGFPRRLMVAARFGDDLTTDDVVTWGPRVENLDPGDLVGRIFSGCDPELRSRLAAGPSGLVAGRNALAGPRGEVSAWVLSRAGVRVVLALSFAPNAMRDLAATGVLALEWPQPKHGAMEPGDEIEVAGGLESLAEGVPVTVRNLARGTQELLRHGLDARWLDILRAGGLIRHGLGNVPRRVGSRDSGMTHRVAGGA